MKRRNKTSDLNNYVEWLKIKSYFNKNMKGKLHRQPSLWTQNVFKRMMIKHKMQLLILLLCLFVSCEKEPIYRKVYFTFEVIQAPVTIQYLSEDGQNIVHRIIHSSKPVFRPGEYPSQITVTCEIECLYKVNGKEYNENRTFNF